MKIRKTARGFTLIELMATLSVVAITLTLGVPSFNGLRASMQRTQAALSLTSAFTLARSEAARRGVSVTVCPSANGTSCVSGGSTDWSSGWITFTDIDGNATIDSGTDELLNVVRIGKPVFKLEPETAVQAGVTFSTSGFPDATGTFSYKDDKMTCQLRLSAIGRVERITNEPGCS